MAVLPLRNPLGASRRSLSGAFLALVLSVSGAEAQPCENYADYLHWIGGMSTTGTGGTIPDEPSDLVIEANTAYIADGSGGLTIADVSTPGSPVELGNLSFPIEVPLPDVPMRAQGVAVQGDYAYVAAWDGDPVSDSPYNGLHVVDITDPALPSLVTNVGPGPGYRFRAQDVVVDGGYAYVLAAGWSTFDPTTLFVVDISPPDSAYVAASLDISLQTGGHHIAMDGPYLYITNGQFTIVDVSSPLAPLLRGTLFAGGKVGSVAAQNGIAYVSDGIWQSGTTEFYVINAFDPDSPFVLGQVTTERGGGDMTVSGTLAYMAESDGVTVIDVTSTLTPEIIGRVELHGEITSQVRGGVAVSGDYIFGSSNSAGLQVADASNPYSPPTLLTLTGIGDVRDVARRGDLAYVATKLGLYIFNVSDPLVPAFLGSAAISDGSAVQISSDGKHALMTRAFASSGALTAINVEDPTNPFQVGQRSFSGRQARDIELVGKYALVVALNQLYVIDTSSPTTLPIVGVNGAGNGFDLSLTDTHAFLAIEQGLGVLDISSLPTISFVTQLDIPGDNQFWPSLAVAGDYAYLTHRSTGLNVIDISNPATPMWLSAQHLVESIEPLGFFDSATKVLRDALFVGFGYSGMHVYDITIPDSPQLRGSVDPLGNETPRGRIDNITIDGDDRIYLSDLGSGLHLVPIDCLARVPAPTLPPFEVEKLPELAGSTSVAIGMGVDASDLPLPVGWSTDSGDRLQAIAWTLDSGDRQPEPLTHLDPTKDGWANGAGRDSIANNVIAFGASHDAGAAKKPVLWSRDLPDTPFGAPVTLPTLPGGVGEVLGSLRNHAANGGWWDDHILVGISTTGGAVERAVFWAEDSTGGTWEIGELPHYAAELEGRATQVYYGGPDYFAAGSAESDLGDTIPQVWKSDDQGTSWTRTPLPLLPAGVHGQVESIVSSIDPMVAVGWTEMTGGNRRAVRWESADLGQTWTVASLGVLPGRTQSEASSYMGAEDDIFAPELSAIVGTSYDENPEADGIATLWIEDAGDITAHDLNDLVSDSHGLVLRAGRRIVRTPLGPIHVSGFGETEDTGSGPHAFLANATDLTDVGDPGGPIAGYATPVTRITAAPNPFSKATTFSFALPSASPVTVTVLDAAGRRVASLVDRSHEAGRYDLAWDGRNDAGRLLSPGVYFVKLQSEESVAFGRVTLIR